MPSARSVSVLAVAGLVAALAGCAAVPESGSVHVGRSIAAGAGVEPNEIRVIASAPVPGMDPTALVTGFFNALVDSDADYHIASLYLAPGAVWHTTTGTMLYDARSAVRVGARGVDVTLRRVGVIDSHGNFRVTPGTLHTHFTVARSDGQWRISRLPSGILLSTSDADRTLQSATIYFFNRALTRLVPQPVLVPPDQPGLATTLIRELVEGGPSRDLAPAVLSAVPNGTGLVGNVPISNDGVAEVDLAGSVQQLLPAQLQRLSAQIVWTLRQLPAVTAVRLLVNGSPLSVAGVARVQPIDSWPQFDPATPPTSRGALLSDHGRVGALSTTVPPALRHRQLEAPAVSADGKVVAALRRGSRRTTLLVGPPGGPLRARWSATTLSPPTFDPQGNVLAVSGVGARSKVIEVPRAGAVREVSVPRLLRTQGISQIAISRDGSRIAMVVGPPTREGLDVGAISVVHGVMAIDASLVVIPGASDVRGVAWAGANAIVTTVRDSSRRRSVVETGVDGYEPHVLPASGLPADATQVAAAPAQRTLAAAGDGVWMLSGSSWQRVATGNFPSYAG